MKRRYGLIIEIMNAITAAVLFTVILSLVMLSAGSYRLASANSDDSSSDRALLSYIINSVRDSGSQDISLEERMISAGSADAAGKMSAECLIIRDDKGNERRFYCLGGRLLEEFSAGGTELNSETALEIGRTELIDFSEDERGILTVRTDRGSSCVKIRK